MGQIGARLLQFLRRALTIKSIGEDLCYEPKTRQQVFRPPAIMTSRRKRERAFSAINNDRNRQQGLQLSLARKSIGANARVVDGLTAAELFEGRTRERYR